MTEIKDVREWADSVCNQAITEGRAGNPILANKIATNAALKFYFDNVHGLHSMSADSFPYYKQAEWAEITRLYEAYIQDQRIAESVDKVDALETKVDAGFAKLEQMIAQFVESQKPAEEVKPAKPAKKGKKAEKEAEVVEEVEAEEATESEEAEAESEA